MQFSEIRNDSFDDTVAYSLSYTGWTELRPNIELPRRENIFERFQQDVIQIDHVHNNYYELIWLLIMIYWGQPLDDLILPGISKYVANIDRRETYYSSQ